MSNWKRIHVSSGRWGIALAALTLSAQAADSTFCKSKFLDPGESAWADVACERLTDLKNSKNAYAEFFLRSSLSSWSGYEFNLSNPDIQKVFAVELKMQNLKGAPRPFALYNLSEDFAKAKVPRTGAALAFMIRTLPLADGAFGEAVAEELGSSFNRSPEQFVKVVQGIAKENRKLVGETVQALEFASSSAAIHPSEKSRNLALKLEAESGPEMQPFFEYIKKMK